MSGIAEPGSLHYVLGLAPATDGAARTADYVCLKNYNRCWIVCAVEGGAAAAMDINPYEADDVTPSNEQAIATAARYWMNADTSLTDTNSEQTAATSVDTAATAKDKLVIIEIDPAKLSAGYDCVTVKTEGDNASNLISVVYVLEPKYCQTAPPTAITD